MITGCLYVIFVYDRCFMKKYLPFILILMMVFIIIGSSLISGPKSYGFSRNIAVFINKVLHALGEPENTVTTIDLIIRKLAHFMEYLILTILLSIGFSNVVKKQGWALLTSTITTGFISMLDEAFIQTASGRNSSLFDIMVDFMGIGAGLIVFTLMLWLNVKTKR